MKIYFIIIITILTLIILPIIIFYIVLYIRNSHFNNIKGNKPPEPPKVNPKPYSPDSPDSPDSPTKPFVFSAYNHTLDLTSYGLNKYVITCKFYNNNTLSIYMDVYNKNGTQIAKSLFDKNTWTTVDKGYQISYDPDLLNEIKNAPITCSLNPFIKYISGTPNTIIVNGSVKVIISFSLNEKIEQCSDVNC